MPAKSEKQAKYMRACAHGWSPSKGKCPSKKVARKFMHTKENMKWSPVAESKTGRERLRAATADLAAGKKPSPAGASRLRKKFAKKPGALANAADTHGSEHVGGAVYDNVPPAEQQRDRKTKTKTEGITNIFGRRVLERVDDRGKRIPGSDPGDKSNTIGQFRAQDGPSDMSQPDHPNHARWLAAQTNPSPPRLKKKVQEAEEGEFQGQMDSHPPRKKGKSLRSAYRGQANQHNATVDSRNKRVEQHLVRGPSPVHPPIPPKPGKPKEVEESTMKWTPSMRRVDELDAATEKRIAAIAARDKVRKAEGRPAPKPARSLAGTTTGSPDKSSVTDAEVDTATAGVKPASSSAARKAAAAHGERVDK